MAAISILFSTYSEHSESVYQFLNLISDKSCLPNYLLQLDDDFRHYLAGVTHTATSAAQIEGAWNVSGRSPSIWDVYSRVPGATLDGSTPDDACKSYYFWQRDIEMLKFLGVNFYRLSISWPRLLPTGYSNVVSKSALEYYNNIINALLDAGIEPAISIYHWELPENLQKLGGWANPLVSDWCEDFARVMFDNFGDRVKVWFTINEPFMTGYWGYGKTTMAPGLNAHGFGEYIAAKNMMMAHARLYHLYDNIYRKKQRGKIGIVHLLWYASPLSDSECDRQVASDAMGFYNGIYLNPIFSLEGGFPERVVELVAKRSAEQGYRSTRFPQLTNEERDYVKGTSDFLGVNYYEASVNFTRSTFYRGMYDIPSLLDDLGAAGGDADNQISGDEMPSGIRNGLLWVKEKYNNPPILITENGYLDGSAGLKDPRRLDYHKKYLYTILNTTINEGMDIQGYIAWTLMDDFEWNSGYTKKLGLFETDFADEKRTRTLRLTGAWYRDVIASRVVDLCHVPETQHVSF